MASFFLCFVLIASLGTMAWVLYHNPRPVPPLAMLIVVVVILALVGLLALWGLPIASDLILAALGRSGA